MRINYEKWKEHWEEMMIKNGIEYTYIVATETIAVQRRSKNKAATNNAKRIQRSSKIQQIK